MALLPILTAPDPRLKSVAKPVEAVDDEVRQLMSDMLETMYTHVGYGLAATQVGIDKRVIVMDINIEDEENKPPMVLKMANPEVLWASSETSEFDEACFSVPAQHAKVTRPAQVRIRYLDENNKARELEADGLLATCIQHEIDHLNGILFIDHLSVLKREMIVRKLLKERKRKQL